MVAHGSVETDLRLPFQRLPMAEAFAEHCNGLDILGTGGDVSVAARYTDGYWANWLASATPYTANPYTPSTRKAATAARTRRP